MKRRDFITLLAGAAWPLAARGQQRERMCRIGVLSEFATDRPATRAGLLEFRQALEQLGWSEDRNIVIEYRFAGGSSDRFLPLAQELIALRPDVILATGTPITAILQRETRAIPMSAPYRLRTRKCGTRDAHRIAE